MSSAESTAPAPLEVRVRRVPGLPVVSIRVWLRGGCLVEPLAGVSNLAGRLLVEGTGSRDWELIARAADERGMLLSSFGGLEAHGLALDALAGDLELALEWAAELVLDSRFPAERCAWVKRQVLAELESLADQPEIRTAWAFFRQLYHPYPAARPVLGEPADLERAQAEDCRRFHERALARGLIVTVAGDLDEDVVARRIESLFAATTSALAATDGPSPPRGTAEETQVVPLPAAELPQAQLYLGHLSVERRHPEYRALEVAGIVLGAGGSLSGRIPARLRETEGLAYTAQAHAVAGAGLGPGRLVVHLATAPEQVTRAREAVMQELVRFVEAGLSEAEMLAGRTYLLRREPFLRETARQWADLMAESLFYGLPLDDFDAVRDEILAVEQGTVEEAIRRHVSPDELRTTIGLPE